MTNHSKQESFIEKKIGEFKGRFCTPDIDFTEYMKQVAKANEKMIPFIRSSLKDFAAEVVRELEGIKQEGGVCFGMMVKPDESYNEAISDSIKVIQGLVGEGE